MKLRDAQTYLKRAFDTDRLAHAYVVEGMLRAEASELALWVAALLLCEAEGDAPCGSCYGCRAVADGSHPDLGWEEPRKKSRMLSIDQMRELQKRAYQTSFKGGWKVCVLAGADCMNRSSANAFLKTLEEPPARTMFLLLTDSPQALLPTIISRCQRIVLARTTDGLEPEWRERLLAVLTRPSGGEITRLGRANLLARMLVDLKKQVADEVKAEATEDETVESETEDARASSVYRERRQAIMRSLQLWYRDILLSVYEAPESSLAYPEALETLRTVAAGRTPAQALADVALVETAAQRMDARNMAEQIVLEQAFLQLS